MKFVASKFLDEEHPRLGLKMVDGEFARGWRADQLFSENPDWTLVRDTGSPSMSPDGSSRLLGTNDEDLSEFSNTRPQVGWWGRTFLDVAGEYFEDPDSDSYIAFFYQLAWYNTYPFYDTFPLNPEQRGDHTIETFPPPLFEYTIWGALKGPFKRLDDLMDVLDEDAPPSVVPIPS